MARRGARSEAGAERKGTKIRRKTGVPVTVLLAEVKEVAALVEAHAAPCEAHAGLASVDEALGPAFAARMRELAATVEETPPRRAPCFPAGVLREGPQVVTALIENLRHLVARTGPKRLVRMLEARVRAVRRPRNGEALAPALRTLVELRGRCAAPSAATGVLDRLVSRGKELIVMLEDALEARRRYAREVKGAPGARALAIEELERMMFAARAAAKLAFLPHCRDLYRQMTSGHQRERQRVFRERKIARAAARPKALAALVGARVPTMQQRTG